MKAILIMGDTTEKLTDYIENNFNTSISIIKKYKTIDDAYNELMKLQTLADILIFNDNALGDNPMDAVSKLKTLDAWDYFSVKEIMHLSSTTTNYDSYSKFIFKDSNRFILYKKDLYTTNVIMNCINSRFKDELKEDKKNKYSEIVRQKVDSKDKIIIKENNENSTVIITDTSKTHMAEKKDRQKKVAENSRGKKAKLKSQTPPIENLKDIELTDLSLDKLKLTDQIEIKDTKKADIILVSGERSSGKTSLAYALGKSASNTKKVLLIDGNIDNLGLSALIETLKENVTTVYLHDFIADVIRITSLLQDTNKNLNSISISLKTTKFMSEAMIGSAIQILLSKLRYSFDTIIVDIPLSKIMKMPDLLTISNTILITTQLYKVNLVSLAKLILYTGLTKEFLKNKNLILIPMDITKGIKGIPKITIDSFTSQLNHVSKLNFKSLSEISIQSFDIDSTLYNALDMLTKEGI